MDRIKPWRGKKDNGAVVEHDKYIKKAQASGAAPLEADSTQ